MHRANTTGLWFVLPRFFRVALFFLIIAPFANLSVASASVVEKVRGKQAIVAFDGGQTASAGDKFFAIENGKKKAILEVVQFKNGRAKVKVLKGTAKEGMTLVLARAKTNPTDAAANDEAPVDPDAAAADAAEQANASTRQGKKKRLRNAGAATLLKDLTVGATVGYALDSQTVAQTGQAKQSMSGSGYSFKGFADVPVTGSLGLLTRFGVEQFNVAAGSVKTEIMYGVADLLLKYNFNEGNMVYFAMGGLGIHFPISKSSTILDVNRISSTTVFYGGGGFNFIMGGSTYLQLTAEYGMFPPSNDVTTSIIAARAGLGFRF